MWQFYRKTGLCEKQEIETAVPPLSTKDYEIPFAILRADDKDQKKDTDAEYTLTVSFRLKEDMSWADAGHEVAFGQKIYKRSLLSMHPKSRSAWFTAR